MRIQLSALYREHVAALAKGFAQALEAEGYDAAVIHSGRLTSKSHFDDQYFAMNPVPMFSYWTPVRWPDCAIHVSNRGEAKLVVYRDHSYWEQPVEPDWTLIRAGLEVIDVSNEAEQTKALSPTSRTAFIGQDAAHAKELGFDVANPAPLLERLHELRVFKTPYEVECMAEASRIGARGHRATAEAFAAGERSELALHLLYLGATNQDDADTPYKNIVALGAHAATLHHVTYQAMPDARSFLIDAGGMHLGYSSDITRTHADGNGLFADLLGRMEEMQKRIVAKVSAGTPYEQLHDDSHHELGKVLSELGIGTASAEALVASGVTRKLFPHGLGHSLGIQVHDVGCRKKEPRSDNPFLRNTRNIEAGQVFTIEPGCYFIGSLLAELKASDAGSNVDWKKIDALRPYGGIRIEDNVLVLPAGSRANVRNLTREAFAAT